MKKLFLLFSVTVFTFYCIGQSVKTIEATILENSYPSDEDFRAIDHYRNIYASMYNENWEKIKTEDELLPEERKYVNMIREKYEHLSLDDGEAPWEVLGPGCSWYCGAHYKMQASSTLSPSGKNTYDVDHLWDDDVRTAWVEGVKGYGIGEYITFDFPEGSPRATSCELVNGYSKDEKTWRNNSRVKTFHVYEDDQLVSIIHLLDTRCIQTFPLENHRRDKQAMTLKFVITDVYKGDKYDDTAISELIFDGEDVHCFVAGTRITLANGSTKPIEEMKEGDEVLSYNIDKNTFFSNKVHSFHTAIHQEMVSLALENGMNVTATGHHPFRTLSGWMSFYPETTAGGSLYDSVSKYEQGSLLGIHTSGKIEYIPLTDIGLIHGTRQTYTLKLTEKGCFIANGFVVGQE